MRDLGLRNLPMIGETVTHYKIEQKIGEVVEHGMKIKQGNGKRGQSVNPSLRRWAISRPLIDILDMNGNSC